LVNYVSVSTDIEMGNTLEKLVESSSPLDLGPTLAIGYALLLTVNYIVGSGAFGVRSNKITSDAYPTEITPAGFTFSIWGLIFLLQGGGTAIMMMNNGDPAVTSAVAAGWFATWMLQNLWQGVFLTAPVPRQDGSPLRRLLTLVPSAVLIVGAHATMLTAALALRSAAAVSRPALLAATFLIDFPTGVNAGWLSAASGIGITLVAREVPSLHWMASANGGACLLTALTLYGAAASAYLGADSLFTGLGYASAVAWACNGITRRDKVDPAVANAANRGIILAALGAAAAVALPLLL
jgi:hypothetical protein